MDIQAKIITGIKYTPFLCRNLNSFSLDDLGQALSKEATFFLDVDEKNKIAVSWWVSPKRTRSYPYARVYDSLKFTGKKITIIPILKDEGKEGDRDFLQWDTVSLMSLLGIYVIISYYSEAIPSSRYEKKITEQRYDLQHVKNELEKLLSYQSDALHWNLSNIKSAGAIGEKALEAYARISKKLKIEMHSADSAKKRITELLKGKDAFLGLSRKLAQEAQKRESLTKQPKEKLSGAKATITIKNYLGGNYYFTADEALVKEKNIYLIEGKHTRDKRLPSLGDVKDGLLKMILFTNLEDVKIFQKEGYSATPVLKLTTGRGFNLSVLKKSDEEILNLLKQESQTNNFKVQINQSYI